MLDCTQLKKTYGENFPLKVLKQLNKNNNLYSLINHFIYVKDINVSQNGCILLNVTSKDIKINCLYKRKLKKLSIVSESQVDNLTK